jgi:hypothetical protein
LERRWPGPIGNPKLNQEIKASVIDDLVDFGGIEDLTLP